MDFLQNNKKTILVFLLLSFLFFFTRVYQILSLPIFTDEAIYVRWSQIAKDDASWRFISLTDGKQPMFVWLAIVFMKFVSDPLLAGRMVSVFAGFFTMIGIFFLTKEAVKSTKIGLLAMLLYVFFPFALVYDRMALYDSLVSLFSVWSLYFQLLLVKNPRLDTALVLGIVTGGGLLTKSSGFFSIYLLPLSLLLFDWQRYNLKQRFIKWFGLVIVSIFFAYSYYSILRLSPFFHIINEKNALFVYPFSEWLLHPFRFLVGNLRGVFDWLITYMSLPLFLLSLFPFFLKRHGDIRIKLFLFASFFMPFFLLALFGKSLYPRFILFMSLPLLVLLSLSIYEVFRNIKQKFWAVIFFVLLVYPLLKSDFFILTNFSVAPIPFADLEQYINSWPAGGGIKEAVDFFNKEAEEGPIFVATQGTFGLMPYSLEIYLHKNPNIKIVGFWPINEDIPKAVLEESLRQKTYFVFYQPCPSCREHEAAPASWPVELVFKLKKGISEHFLYVYKIN